MPTQTTVEWTQQTWNPTTGKANERVFMGFHLFTAIYAASRDAALRPGGGNVSAGIRAALRQADDAGKASD